MTGIILHVGLSKTGTTTLQRAVFENHSQIYYLGKIQKSTHPRQCISADTYDFLEPLLWKVDQPYDADAQKSFFEETLTPRVDAGKLILGSWEGLSGQDITSFEASINRLLSVCGDCKVLISLRNPLTRLPSSYLQHLRGNQKQLVETFVSFEQWLALEEERLGSLEKTFSYREYVEVAIRLLGVANVGVFLYEEFDAEPEQYLKGVSGFLGIDAEETIKLAEGRREHTRLFTSQVDQMKKINSSLIGRFIWRLSNVDKRKKAIGFSDNAGVIQTSVAEDVPATVELSPECTQRISDAARESNQWLVDNLNLELEKYGYPL